MRSLSTRPASPLARAAHGAVRVAGVGASVGLVLLAILMGGLGIGPFVDPPSLLIVAAPTLGLTVACFGVRAPAESVGFLFAGAPTLAQLSQGAGIACSVGAFALGAGMLGSIIGMVQMLQNMSEPSTIGPAMAVSLLSTFYGVGVAMAAFACALRLVARSGDAEVLGATGTLGLGVLGAAGLALYGPTVFMCFAIAAAVLSA